MLGRRCSLISACCGVLAFASILRTMPMKSESLHWDAVDYVRASREGFLANWIDQGHPGIANLGKMFKLDLPYDKTVMRRGVDVFWLRHFHPPMLAYVLRLQEKVLGFSDFKVRLYSILAGSLNCAFLVVAVWALRPTGILAIMSGVLAGVMLGATPYHLSVSRTASYHALFPLLVSLFLFALARGLDQRRFHWLGVAFGLGAVCLATFDWAVLLPFVLVGSMIIVKSPWLMWKRGLGLIISPSFVVACVGSTLLFAMLWPAGIVKADLFQGLAYNSLYSSFALNKTAGAGSHWWDVYVWYYRTGPVIAVLQLVGMVYVLQRALRGRESGLWAWLLFAMLFLLVSVRQRQVYVHYVSPLFPVGSVFAGVLAHDLGRRVPWRAGVLVPAILLLSCIASAVPKWHRPFTDPHEVPGFSQAAAFLREIGDREGSILATAAPLLSFYLVGFDIRELPLGPMPPHRIEELRRHRHRFVTINLDQLDPARGFVDDPGHRFVVENLSLRKTIRHLRRDFECLWIYEDPLWTRPARVPIEPRLFQPLSTRPGFDLWHVPLDSLPFGEPDLVQLYLDGRIADRHPGWPYRNWHTGYYAMDIANPRVGLVVAVPRDSSPSWFSEHSYVAAVARTQVELPG